MIEYNINIFNDFYRKSTQINSRIYYFSWLMFGGFADVEKEKLEEIKEDINSVKKYIESFRKYAQNLDKDENAFLEEVYEITNKGLKNLNKKIDIVKDKMLTEWEKIASNYENNEYISLSDSEISKPYIEELYLEIQTNILDEINNKGRLFFEGAYKDRYSAEMNIEEYKKMIKERNENDQRNRKILEDIQILNLDL